MVFLRADWGLQWSTQVTATDASLFGFEVCTTEWPRATVAEDGRISERSHFRAASHGERRGARESFFATNADNLELFDIADSGPLAESGQFWSIESSFPELDGQLLRQDMFVHRATGPFLP